MVGSSGANSRILKEPERRALSSVDKSTRHSHKPNRRSDTHNGKKRRSKSGKKFKSSSNSKKLSISTVSQSKRNERSKASHKSKSHHSKKSKMVSEVYNSKASGSSSTESRHKRSSPNSEKGSQLSRSSSQSQKKHRSLRVASLSSCTTALPFDPSDPSEVISAKRSIDLSLKVPRGPLITPMPYLRALWMSAGRSNARKRLLIVVRAVERMDRVHGEKWTSTEIVNGWPKTDQKLLSLVTQNFSFKNNPPITKLGRHQSQLVMRAIMLRGLKPKKIICSPALRCVQTACAMANYIGGKVCVEPGLFEPSVWYRENGGLPTLKASTFVGLGYPIDQEYLPIVRDSYFACNETELEARQRIDLVLRTLGLSYLEGPLLIVGHAVTLHTAFLMGRRQPPEDPLDPNYNDLDVTSMDEQWDSLSEKDEALNTAELGIRYPPGCVVTIAREADGPPAIYQLIPGIVPPLTYGRQFSNKPVHPVVV